MTREAEYVVVGGGLVGMAIAYGLAIRGRDVAVLDEGDVAYRASRGNFGLVWVQSKGVGMPDYARWSRRSAALWPQFRDRLTEASGVALELAQPGGLQLFLSDDEAEVGVAQLERLRAALGDYPFEFLGHNAVRKLVPEIGPEVVGGTFSPMDGHVNPLYLLRALNKAFAAADGRLANGATVERIEPGRPFALYRGDGERWDAGNVVLAAGLGNKHLAPMVGLEAPVEPNRGQVLVTEKVRPFLELPTVTVRQVGEGAVQIGDSKENVGFDDTTDPKVVGAIAARATKLFPLLESVRVVRSWAALRVMSPDGHPIYERSRLHPGASLVTCHSGVTLAAAHALTLAGWIDGGDAPQDMEVFGAKRFAVQAA